MSAPAPAARKILGGPVGVAVGLLLAIAAWLMPVNLRSVSPALLQGAGEGTPSVSAFGRQLVDAEKIGPAGLVAAAARTVGDPGSRGLAAALRALISRQPTFAAWGGWDPFLDPLFSLRKPTGYGNSTPILFFFISEKGRATLRSYLTDSGSLGVQSLLRLREVPVTGRFVPANRAGGQPLDALILLTALLYQGEHLSPPLQRELRVLAEAAWRQKSLGLARSCSSRPARARPPPRLGPAQRFAAANRGDKDRGRVRPAGPGRPRPVSPHLHCGALHRLGRLGLLLPSAIRQVRGG